MAKIVVGYPTLRCIKFEHYYFEEWDLIPLRCFNDALDCNFVHGVRDATDA